MTTAASVFRPVTGLRVSRVSLFPAVNRLNVRVLLMQVWDVAALLLSGPTHPFATEEVAS
ncbi:hypothetical protein BHQ23_29350 [Mycobacterium gordonae]|uniref:Uncharacterized protein n=1 Tax=Mycobacterium gordonae TaxID=1778 RepID=A0A1X1WPT1_MYCGO|nr:hypothetical protein BHQ23_29350 [Mycobacterium gordonae]ORV88502.1 hypothetical protein AWC08_22190 [Mycobacterium gordonae]